MVDSEIDNIGIEPLTDFLTEATILTKPTLDLLLKQDNAGDLIALYTFYYYTSKWQKTNIPKATTSYVAKGLGWGVDKVKKYKKSLIDIGLIENIARKDEFGKVIGWYIRVCYIISKNTINNLKIQKSDFQACGLTENVENSEIFQKVDFPPAGFYHRWKNTPPNALSALNENALNTDKERVDEVENTNIMEEDSSNSMDNLSKKDSSALPVFEQWNEFAAVNGLASIKGLSDKRKKHLKQRLCEKEFDFNLILNCITESDFLLGKNDRGWKVDFDFIVENGNNYLKILEGKYKNKNNQNGQFKKLNRISGGSTRPIHSD